MEEEGQARCSVNVSEGFADFIMPPFRARKKRDGQVVVSTSAKVLLTLACHHSEQG
jgi:hypothetical protein